MNLNTKFKVGQVVYYYDWDLEEIRKAEIVDIERIATEKGQTTLYLFKHPYNDGNLQGCESDLVSLNKQEIHPEEIQRLDDYDGDTYTDEVEFDDSDLGKIFCITTEVGKVNLKFTSVKLQPEKVTALFSTFDSKFCLGVGAKISATRDATNVFELTKYDLGERPDSKTLSTILAIEAAATDVLSSADYKAKLRSGLSSMDLFVIDSF